MRGATTNAFVRLVSLAATVTLTSTSVPQILAKMGLFARMASTRIDVTVSKATTAPIVKVPPTTYPVWVLVTPGTLAPCRSLASLHSKMGNVMKSATLPSAFSMERIVTHQDQAAHLPIHQSTRSTHSNKPHHRKSMIVFQQHTTLIHIAIHIVLGTTVIVTAT